MKKDEDRFTIRFNPADPRQKITRDALTAAGRRKALLITDAVCEYLARHGGDGTVVNIPLVPYLPVAANGAISDTANAYAYGTSNIEGSAKPTSSDFLVDTGNTGNAGDADDTNDTPDTLSIDDDMREAILEGLGAFKV